jgi:hypothetical protein
MIHLRDPGGRQWQVYRHSSRENPAKGKGRDILIAAFRVEGREQLRRDIQPEGLRQPSVS